MHVQYNHLRSQIAWCHEGTVWPGIVGDKYTVSHGVANQLCHDLTAILRGEKRPLTAHLTAFLTYHHALRRAVQAAQRKVG